METLIDCNKLDKRTKAYKECLEAQDTTSKGLGDTIEKITKATGIKAAVEWFSEQTGIDCGCDKRQEKLNKLWPYQKTECLTKSEYDYLDSFYKKEKRLTVSKEEQAELVKIHNRVFHSKKRISTCAPCVKGLVKDLHALYEAY